MSGAYRPEPEIVPAVATVVGDELHVPKNGILPDVCLKCGQTQKLRTGPREVVWIPAVLVFGWFLMPVFALVAMALLRKHAEIVYSLCRPCEERRRDAMTMMRVLIVGALVTFLASCTMIFNGHPIVGLVFVFGGGAAGYVLYKRRVVGRTLDVMWIHSDGTVALRGVHAIAMRECAAPKLRARR